MAFAAITTSVKAEDITQIKIAAAGEAFAAGAVVRKDATGLLKIADAELAAEDNVDGVALAAAVGVGSQVGYAPIGAILTVSGLTAGQTYYLGGATDEGKIGLFADAVTGTHFATIVGIALSATRLLLIGKETNVQL